MSTGLLHRLAARATGSAWTVRSDARLGLGAGHLLEGEATQDPAPVASGSATPSMDAAPLVRSARPASPAAAPQAKAMPHGQATVVNAPPASPPPLLPPASAMPGFASPRPVDQAMQPPHTSHETGAQVHAPAAGRRVSPSQAPQAPQATTRPAIGAAQKDFPQPANQPPLRNEPAPLLPPVRTAAAQPGAAAPQPPAAGRWTGVSQHPANQDTEVHIHIGRIDVTAVHEAPKPKARARERTQPVSLDAYLATRNVK